MTTSVKISTLWIVVMLNMVFADVLSLFYPGVLPELMTGTVEGIELTPALLLVSAVFIEIGIIMIFATRALASKSARFANLVAAPLTMLFVVGGGSFKLHYLLFGGIEVVALGYIAYLAWTWHET